MIEMASKTELRTTEAEPAPIESELLTDQVWQDLGQTMPRAIVAQIVDQLLAKYRDGAIQTFVPVLVRREARDLLHSVNLTEPEFKVTE
jgi:hypothetical protein